MVADTSLPNHTLPARILLEKWQDVGFFWQGKIAIADLPRLCAQVDSDTQNAKQPDLMVSCRLSKKADGVLRLSFEVAGDVWLVCHRCLIPMAVSLTDDYSLAILADIKAVDLVADEAYILLDELGENQRYLPIKDLLEDELLLALPLAIHHEDCQAPAVFVDEGIDVSSKENPFLALASLKGHLS